MPDINTRADSVRIYLTGAASDGAAQANPDASLGNYRSSTEATSLGITVTNAISNITVDYASGTNGAGAGTLTAASSTTLTWTPPGGSAGTAVTIANGETKVLEGGSAPTKYIRVTRTSASSLTGTATVTLAYNYAGVFGMDNVSSSEATAGQHNYRAVMFKNTHATVSATALTVWVTTLGTQRTSDVTQLGSSGSGTIVTTGSLADWPDSGWCRITTSGGSLREIVYYDSRTSTTLNVSASSYRGLLGTSAAAGSSGDLIDAVPGIRIAKEATSASAIQTIANETSAPTGVTWSSSITKATGVSIGTLATSGLYGLWIDRHTPAGAASSSSIVHGISYDFDSA